MPDWAAICKALDSLYERPESVSGGDISAAWRLGNLFVKTGPVSSHDMFRAEADGLREIANSETIRVPDVCGVGAVGDSAYIALEWLELGGRTAGCDAQLGERLAAMHRTTESRFGWYRDNTIGATPQPNNMCDDWIEFFAEQRLQHQLRLASAAGYGDELQQKGRQLLTQLPAVLGGVDVVPSLLHGDLWGGNWGISGGEPVLFDPAVYYGDRETDIAMTRLFGGFGKDFYRAYESVWPLPAGHEIRCIVYQLYHVLNHLNLFGRSYLSRAIGLLDAVV